MSAFHFFINTMFRFFTVQFCLYLLCYLWSMRKLRRKLEALPLG